MITAILPQLERLTAIGDRSQKTATLGGIGRMAVRFFYVLLTVAHSDKPYRATDFFTKKNCTRPEDLIQLKNKILN
jgi:hypothetical protein